MRADASEAAIPSVADIHRAVATAMPQATIKDIALSDRASFAPYAYAEMPDGQVRLVYVDPVSLQVTGSTSALNTQRFFRDLHMDFFGLLSWGKFAVCIFAIPLLISAVTPLLFYKRWWRRFLDLRIDKGAKAFWSGLHKVAGLSGLALTGGWLHLQRMQRQAATSKWPGAALAAASGIAITLICLASALVHAVQASPASAAFWPDVSPATVAIALVWFASTFGVGFTWLYCLRPCAPAPRPAQAATP